MIDPAPVIEHRWRGVVEDALPSRQRCMICSLHRLAEYHGPCVPCDPRLWAGRNPPPMTAEALAASLAHGTIPEVLTVGDTRLADGSVCDVPTAFVPCTICQAAVVAVFQGYGFADGVCRACEARVMAEEDARPAGHSDCVTVAQP